MLGFLVSDWGAVAIMAGALIFVAAVVCYERYQKHQRKEFPKRLLRTIRERKHERW